MNIKLYVSLLFFLLFPTIKISGSFFLAQELFLYLFAFFFFIIQKRIIITPLAKPFIIYLLCFTLTIAIVSLISQIFFTNEDFFIIRSIIQTIISIIFFSELLNSKYDLQKTVFFSILIISTPALVSFIQISDLLGLKLIIKDLYHPVYGFSEFGDLSEFRTTSVFKDSFIASVYFSTISIFIFYAFIKIKYSSIKKLIIGITLIMIYGSMLFVGRTGLVFIPLSLLAIILITLSPKNILKFIPAFGIIILTSCGILYYLHENYYSKLEWAFEVIKLFDKNEVEAFSSVSDMNEMNIRFLNNLFENIYYLLAPHHTYDLDYTMSSIYTDNFYFQEIYRYGIFGIISLIIFYISMIKTNSRSKGSLIIVLLLIILNIKGGNTFFMSKNIYIYSFIFVVLSRISLFEQNNNLMYRKILFPTSQHQDNRASKSL